MDPPRGVERLEGLIGHVYGIIPILNPANKFFLSVASCWRGVVVPRLYAGPPPRALGSVEGLAGWDISGFLTFGTEFYRFLGSGGER